ncbi:conserved membrane hypothetical protein [uncultured Eubacteriales bacterium]|uniref:Uncharacterized protein n=1 Tax=uncultured Eubacteriales bacterium TaxID=172733 RepID=A0A212J4V9_9FIRM|nr:conserved membrane hypothetical protein [uncultured Eubacteriales bacterium]
MEIKFEPAIDLNKRDESPPPVEDISCGGDLPCLDLQNRHNDIIKICELLAASTESFDPAKTYKTIKTYMDEYGRWMYSDISAFLFSRDLESIGIFTTNIGRLQDYSRNTSGNKLDTVPANEETDMMTKIDKLCDHANLAQSQAMNFTEKEDDFKSRFETNIIPFKAQFAHDMNMQFISLIAIFTALSFIVFGGISSLDNIFIGAGSIPITELMITGCIWGLCTMNLVFVFMLFVSRLTKLSICAVDGPKETLARKYPLMVWSNYLLLFLLAVSSWIYYLSYSSSGSWILEFSRNNQVLSFFLSAALITIIFGAIAWLLFKPQRNN